MNPEKLIILGAGNLASHLAPALKDAGYNILQVYSRTEDHAKELADRLNTGWTTDISELDPEAEILIYALTDSIMPQLFCQIELSKRVMVHTAGSIPMDIFKGVAKDYGVMYPVMTFTRGRQLDFRHIPICIEANSDHTRELLERMAGRLSNRVEYMDSPSRKIMHLSGIMANNFSNHLFNLSDELLKKHGMDLSILQPLIQETASKILEISPEEAQTGPARRNDRNIIEEHVEMLKDHPELQKLYTFVSDSITNHFNS